MQGKNLELDQKECCRALEFVSDVCEGNTRHSDVTTQPAQGYSPLFGVSIMNKMLAATWNLKAVWYNLLSELWYLRNISTR